VFQTMTRLTLIVALSTFMVAHGASSVSGGSHHVSLRARHAGRGFVKSLQFKHRLRVCNAYPYSGALDIYRGSEQLTKEPMPYKSCEDFFSQLIPGDKLKFKVGDANAGTFTISDLPNNDAVLLLVIHRHDTLSTAVSFQSHVFANLLNAQIAVIDTYKGEKRARAEIQDMNQGAAGYREEQLRYNSVVAVNPGKYNVLLIGADKNEVKSDLVALNRESYVVLRTGVESQQGPKYDEELVVYPKSDPALLNSAARPIASLSAATLLLLVLATFAVFQL